MAPLPMPHGSAATAPKTLLRRLLGAMSIFTLVMSIPQIVAIWVQHQAAGVSVVTWGAYLLSALLWFWYGLQERDRNIYLPCIGWIAVDIAVVAGAVVYG